jgi:hypothetical protein
MEMIHLDGQLLGLSIHRMHVYVDDLLTQAWKIR